MRQLSTPCLFSDHGHCTGHVRDLYGDEQFCACPCHHHRPPPARGGRAAASSRRSLLIHPPAEVPPAGSAPEREREPPILGLPNPLRLLLLLALAALLYLALCVITAGVANAAAFLLSR